MSLLTICIPTYKRLPLLKTLLDGLLPQAQALGVSVRVNDNCSQDGTAEYLATLSPGYSCLDFGVNAGTVSIDDNMFLSMRPAAGEYIFPLGDDDFLPDGALATIVSELASRPDILVLSGLLADRHLEARGNLLPEELRGKLFEDPRPAFAALWDKMPFGSFVMRREFLDELLFRKYCGTCHAYTGIVWEMLDRKMTGGNTVAVRCMASQTVVLRGGEKSWKDYKARIYLQDIPQWFALLPPVYAEQAAPLREEHLARYGDILSLLAFRRSGQLTRENCRQYMSYFGETAQRNADLAAHLPPLVANMLRFLLKTCRRLRFSP
jgi:glycosyltransferase involved in cell wall biosynthesis